MNQQRELTQEEEHRAVQSWREDLIEAFGQLYAAFPNIRESQELSYIKLLLEQGPLLIDPLKYAESLLKEGRIDPLKYESIVATYKK
jgi:hypothetical protein